MTPVENHFFMPPEWWERDRTFMSWPVRPEAWLEGLDEARDGYAEVANAISEFEPVSMIARPDAMESAKRSLSSAVELIELPHDDSWMRDNGPTFLVDGKGGIAGVNWKFNAWGGKYHPYEDDDLLASRLLDRLGIRRFDAPLVLEGGSIHVDGEETLLATEECLLNKNRNPSLSRSEIEAFLRDYLGVSSFIWLEKGLWGDETDGHVDNVACFVKPGLIAMQVTEDRNDPNFPNTQRNLAILAEARDAKGRKPEIARIGQPPARSCRGESLSLSYINYYPVTGGIILPRFSGSAKASDEAARGLLAELYPGRTVHGIDGMRIIKGGGNVHCITQQMPSRKVNSEG
jgi:agmatine deiminase